MEKTMARINIYNITENENRPNKPFRLKWSIDGRHKSRSFTSMGEANKFRRKLEQALEDGYNFDPNTGTPTQWASQLRNFPEVASEYASSKWHEWAGGTRLHFCDSNAYIIYELIRPKFKNTYSKSEILRVTKEHILNQNSKTISNEDKEIKEFILDNSYRLNEITPEIVTKVLQAVSLRNDGTPLMKGSYRKRKQTFGAVMDYAFRHRYIFDNTFKRVRTKSIQSINAIDPQTTLKPEECRNITQAMRNRAKVQRGRFMEIADFLEFIWLAGLRPSEVAGLKVKNIFINKKGKTSFIKVEQAAVLLRSGYSDDQSTIEVKGLKGRAQNVFRTVPILDELLPVVERVIKDKRADDYIFTSYKNKKRPISTAQVSRYFRIISASSHTPYDLRHANASILIYSGLNIIEVANRLGNSIDVCQKVYLHMLSHAEDQNISKENDYLESTKGSSIGAMREHLIGV